MRKRHWIFFAIFKLLGGIGLFLYGMSLLGASLEKLAGAGLERTLERLTNNRLKELHWERS
ncbi:MAG: hypothetical protein V8S96_03135 [Lachnospiraceae bacterium]